MNTINIDAFPIPIAVGTLGEASREMNTKLIEASKVAFNKVPVNERTGVGITQTIGGLEKANPVYKHLGNVITQFSRDRIFSAGVQKDTIQAEGFWVNHNTQRSAYHMPHSHSSHYVWTGVYFPTSGFHNEIAISKEEDLDEIVEISSTNRPAPGSLVLIDPLHYIKTGIAGDEIAAYPYWGNPISVKPKEGTVVLFPSYLPHLVTPTDEDNFERFSIAFYIRT